MLRGRCVPLACGFVALCMSRVSAQETATYYPGSAVPGRDMPPVPGCTVIGKIFKPLTPAMAPDPYSTRVGWDWCQKECKLSMVTDLYGASYPCQHFTFYPDGKCYLGGSNTVLEDAQTCNSTHPCEHGFQVISGPPDCANKSNWVFPTAGVQEVPATAALASIVPTTAVPAATLTTLAPVQDLPVVAVPKGPKKVGEGEKCNGSLPPWYATICEDGFVCDGSGMLGASGVCTKKQTSVQAVPVVAVPKGPRKVGKGEKCNGSLPPWYATICEDGFFCDCSGMPGASGVCTEKQTTDAAVVTPVTVMDGPITPTTVMMTLPPTATITTPSIVAMTPPAPPSTSAGTSRLPPANGTVVGYFYEPHTMPGTVKVIVSDWEACRELCERNPLCRHFGYWPDGGCHQQGDNVTLTKANTSVISGPRDLSMRELWPNFEESEERDLPPTAMVIHDMQPMFKEVGASSSGGGTGTMLCWLFGALVALALGAGLYGMARFGVETNRLEDEGEDSDDDMEVPMKARE